VPRQYYEQHRDLSFSHPALTQDYLPAVGQTLLDGLEPAGFLRKVSECFLISRRMQIERWIAIA
jgi:hypothetical protein